MSKKLLKVIALSAMIFSFTANSSEVRPGWSIEAGGGKTVTDADNDDVAFHFGTITRTHGDITTTVPVVSYIKEFEQDDSFSLFAGINYTFCNGFVLGAELSYTSHDQHSKHHRGVSDDHDQDSKEHNNHNNHGQRANLSNQSVTLLAKGKYYIDFGGPISPFIGAGVGVSRMELDFNDGVNSFSNLERTKFAYMGTAGLAFDASEDVKLALAYSIRGTSCIEKDDHHHGHSNHHNRNDEHHQDYHRELTSFDDLKNNVQNIEVSVEFKL